MSSVLATTSGHKNAFQLAEERQDRERRQRRPAQRQDDPEEDRVLAGAVDSGRVEQLVGDARDELAHQEHAQRADQERQDQARRAC